MATEPRSSGGRASPTETSPAHPARRRLRAAGADRAHTHAPEPDASFGSDHPVVSPTAAAAGPILERLRRVEGQIRGVQRMIEERQECEAVLTQLLAARAALDRVAGQVVAAHLEECLAGRSPAEARASLERAVQLLARGG